MRICIVNSFYYPELIGGAEIVVYKLAEQLVKKGYEVHVICTDQEDCIDIINGVVIHRIRTRNIYNSVNFSKNYSSLNKVFRLFHAIVDKYNIFNYLILKKKLKKISPDLLHTHNLYGISPIIWSLAHKLNIPIIHTLHDYNLLNHKNNILGFYKQFITKINTYKISFVTAPSQFIMNKYKEEKFFKFAKSQVIFNGIDVNIENSYKVLEYKKNRINKDKIKFVFIGRLTKFKGINFLLNTFSEIENENIELLIAGEGDEKKIIQEYALRDKRIKYCGFISECERDKLLLESDVLIVPSLWEEPFGMVILEAYKCGVPVIATNKGGMPELILTGKTGHVIDTDHKELIQAINYFNSNNILNKMVDFCLKVVLDYSLEKQCNSFSYIYEKIIMRDSKYE